MGRACLPGAKRKLSASATLDKVQVRDFQCASLACGERGPGSGGIGVAEACRVLFARLAVIDDARLEKRSA